MRKKLHRSGVFIDYLQRSKAAPVYRIKCYVDSLESIDFICKIPFIWLKNRNSVHTNGGTMNMHTVCMHTRNMHTAVIYALLASLQVVFKKIRR